jgi:hypothetical protein
MVSDDATPDWKVRLLEYAETLAAVKGEAYVDRMQLWARICLMAATHVPDNEQAEVLQTLVELGLTLGLEGKDVKAMLELVVRAKSDLRRGRASR